MNSSRGSHPSRRRTDHLRYLFDRLLGRETILSTNLFGQQLRLAIAGHREIRRAHEIAIEAPLLERMFNHLAPGDTIYDVGANIGLISLLLTGHPAGTDCKVHSFEPEPRNFRQLCRNIELNGLSGRVTPHQCALGDKEGEVELFVRGGAGEGRHSIATSKGSTGSILVQLMSADTFALSSRATPDMVKIDVEGAEGQVLAGMARMMGDHRPRELFMEIHPKGLGDRMPGGELIDDWLHARGYSLAWENKRGSGRHCHYR